MNDLNPIPPTNCVPLPEAFFDRDTVEVARDLLGRHLMKFNGATGEWLSYRVVETEAYTADDPACHAYQRSIGRAKMLYEHPGTAYVYLIYGMHNCLNVVTEAHGVAGAVLFRALEPVKKPEGDGNVSKKVPLLTNGPGRLTRALDITRDQFNGLPLTQTESGLYLTVGGAVADETVIQTTRIGITKAMDYPWRFYIRENAWVPVRASNDPAKTKPRSAKPKDQAL